MGEECSKLPSWGDRTNQDVDIELSGVTSPIGLETDSESIADVAIVDELDSSVNQILGNIADDATVILNLDLNDTSMSDFIDLDRIDLDWVDLKWLIRHRRRVGAADGGT